MSIHILSPELRKTVESQAAYHLQEEQAAYGLTNYQEDNTLLWNEKNSWI